MILHQGGPGNHGALHAERRKYEVAFEGVSKEGSVRTQAGIGASENNQC